MKENRFVPTFVLGSALVLYWLLLIGSVDFGYHWDERHLMKSAARVPDTGLVLPRWYNYPSVSFLVTLISLAVYVVWEAIQPSLPFIGTGDDTVAMPVQTLAKAILERQQMLIETQADTQQKEEFWIFARIVFASLATLAIPMMYLAFSRLVNRWTALAVCLVFMGSYHVFFHARWIAPDMLQVLWMSLLILFSVSFIQQGGTWRLAAVAVLSGIMVATKYPAGIFLLCPVILANLERVDVLRTAKVISLALVCYLALTPGTLIEPQKFATDVLWEIRHYSEYGHDISTVSPGFAHLTLLGEYLVLRVLNMNPFVSLLLWVFIAVGVAEAVLKNRRLALALLLPAVLYFVYLSTQKVMIVRNALVLLPVLCLCLAMGLDRISKSAKQYATYVKAGIGLLALLSFSLSGSGYAQINASLHNQNFDKSVAERVMSAARSHCGTVYISGAVANLLRASGQASPAQLLEVTDLDRFNAGVCTIFMISETSKQKQDEYFRSEDWTQIGLANRMGRYTVLAGPADVDLDYYPNWKGLERIVVTSPDAGANFAYWKLAEIWVLEE